MPDSALTIALRVAYRAGYQSPATSEAERDAILVAMTEHLPSPEAQVAAEVLHHRRSASSKQLQLHALLGGVGNLHA